MHNDNFVSIHGEEIWGEFRYCCDWRIDAAGVLTVRQIGREIESWGRSAPWHEFADRIVSVRFDGVVRVATCENMFRDCSSLLCVDFSGFDTSGVKSMSGMFAGCSSLWKPPRLSCLDTRGVTDMSGMFERCTSLKTMDLSGLNTSGLERMDRIFFGCTRLESLRVYGWDTSHVKSASASFGFCRALASLDVSGWDTSSLERMDYMFLFCRSLEGLDVSGWDTSHVKSMEYTFRGCNSLVHLDVSRWDISAVESNNSMFKGCSSLNLNLGGEESATMPGWTVVSAHAAKLGFAQLLSLVGGA